MTGTPLSLDDETVRVEVLDLVGCRQCAGRGRVNEILRGHDPETCGRCGGSGDELHPAGVQCAACGRWGLDHDGPVEVLAHVTPTEDGYGVETWCPECCPPCNSPP